MKLSHAHTHPCTHLGTLAHNHEHKQIYTHLYCECFIAGIISSWFYPSCDYFMYIYLTFTRLQTSVYAAQRIFLTSPRVNELIAHHPLDSLSTPTKTHTTTKPPSKSRKQHAVFPLMVLGCCGGLNEKGHPRLTCLNAWSPVNRNVWKGLGGCGLAGGVSLFQNPT